MGAPQFGQNFPSLTVPHRGHLRSSTVFSSLCRERGVPFVGTIPYDRSAAEAVNAGISLAVWDGPASRALRQVYENTMALLGLS